jgi:5-dehydro-4-deoxyglucarate dehydratase
VRSPLTDLTPGEVEELAVLVSRLKASEFASRSLAAA